MTSRVQTNAQAPALKLSTLSGETFNLSNEKPDSFTIVGFYRGLHCPICINYLQEIEENFDTLTNAGINLVAVSMDPKEKAQATVDKVSNNMDLSDPSQFKTRIAYGLTESDACAWGLYLSSKIEGSSEPDVFSEPGLFVMRPDNTVFMAQVQSAPFARPNIAQLVGGLSYAKEHKYPARGTYES